VPIFGLKAEDKVERLKEMDGENEWVFSANTVQQHVDYAKRSSVAGEIMIDQLKSRIKEKPRHQNLRVLDLGAGWGGFQSWQFAKHNFDVIATDLCPEFLLASDLVTQDTFFERVVTDCTVSPFESNTFDIILCKELIHHLSTAGDLFDEIWRVTAPNGLIVVQEPCLSILKNKKSAMKQNIAGKSGITHCFYTINEYSFYMNRIATDIEIDGKVNPLNPVKYPVLSRVFGMFNKALTWNKLFLKTLLLLRGGAVRLIGVKRMKYEKQRRRSNRDIMQIDIQRLQFNNQQVEFYRKDLIPTVFEIFLQAHEEYGKRA
jgi:2-polyprenyl-3-methyl-5-hydroxy-6-metoxy-1,4-benzoquinol methylase